MQRLAISALHIVREHLLRYPSASITARPAGALAVALGIAVWECHEAAEGQGVAWPSKVGLEDSAKKLE